MRFARLPPVGNPISSVSREISAARLDELFGARVSLYGSGTMALAAAIRACSQLEERSGQAEILLPAYGCPDLVSATVYAGCRPVAVDLEKDRPWLDFDDLQNKISDRTAAVVAVNFLGISERISQLKQVARHHRICVIEDSAQSLELSQAPADRGDYVIHSFGRGKPVSLLGGGCVLSFSESMYETLPKPDQGEGEGGGFPFRQSLKLFAYNRLLAAGAYGLVSRLPFLRLGETRFKPLQELAPMPQYARRLIWSNIEAYRELHSSAQEIYRHCLQPVEAEGFVDLARACGHNFARRLLRYPLLMPSKRQRDRVFARLDDAGLGASVMYRRTLGQIPVAADYFATVSDMSNAGGFAGRLLTLPLHTGVQRYQAEEICMIVSKELT